MSKERPQYEITDKKDDYRRIALGLEEKDRRHFFSFVGMDSFNKIKKAVDVYGQTIAECLDEDRLKKLLEDLGYDERSMP